MAQSSQSELTDGFGKHLHVSLIEELAAIKSEHFFCHAAQKITEATNVAYVLITECCDFPVTKLRTLAFSDRGVIQSNIEYALKHTPCEAVISGEISCHPENIQTLYPFDQDLVELEAVGYIAAPFFNPSGEVSGHIALIDTKPLDKSNWLTTVLQAYCSRCGAELESANLNHLTNALAKGVNLSTDNDFFRNLTEIIGDTLGTDHTLIYKLDPYDRRTLRLLSAHHLSNDASADEYSFDSTTLDYQGKDKTAIAKSAAIDVFPDCPLFQKIEASGFIGVGLLNARGEMLGLLCVLQKQAFSRVEKYLDILQMFSARAAHEIEHSLTKNELAFYSEIFSSADDLLSYVDSNYIYRAVSKSYSRNFGLPVEQIIGRSVRELHGEEVFDEVLKGQLDEAFNGQANTREFWRSFDDGSRHCIQGKVTPYIDHNTGTVGAVVCARDITELRTAQIAHLNSEKRLQSMYDDTPSIFFTLDTDAKIISINAYGAEKLGYKVDELIRTSFYDISHQDDHIKLQKVLQQSFANHGEISSWELRKVQQNGDVIWVKETARVVESENHENLLFISSEDISERYHLSQKLSYQATHDSLTNLINRFEFERRLQELIDQVHKGDTETTHVLCYLDLDQFKIINDTCGHLAGDLLLKNLAGMLTTKVRKGDALARLGGDEFGLLMQNCNLDQAEHIAETIRNMVERFEFLWEDKKYTVGVSIGLAAINSDTLSINQVMGAVDAACYAAKDSGRNRIHIVRENDSEISQRRGEMGWVNRLKDAIEYNQFQLLTQKIVDIKDDSAAASYEFLLRLRDGEELVSPATFLPAAERYSLSTLLDRWVVAHAFSWMKNQQSKVEEACYFNINLSGHSLGDRNFLEFVQSGLADLDFLAEKICIEITETAAISNLANASLFIKTLKDKGCLFALDDFGSGLSSFGYLKTLPVDFVKIDGNFIKDIAENPIDLAMVKSINEIAHVMGKKTIAEWVEDESTLICLKEMGVDYAQGYLLGRPQKL